MQKLLILAVLGLAAGCSSKEVYENIQYSNRLDCSYVPPAQYDECLDSTNQSYDEYERERQAVVD